MWTGSCLSANNGVREAQRRSVGLGLHDDLFRLTYPLVQIKYTMLLTDPADDRVLSRMGRGLGNRLISLLEA